MTDLAGGILVIVVGVAMISFGWLCAVAKVAFLPVLFFLAIGVICLVWGGRRLIDGIHGEG